VARARRRDETGGGQWSAVLARWAARQVPGLVSRGPTDGLGGAPVACCGRDDTGMAGAVGLRAVRCMITINRPSNNPGWFARRDSPYMSPQLEGGSSQRKTTTVNVPPRRTFWAVVVASATVTMCDRPVREKVCALCHNKTTSRIGFGDWNAFSRRCGNASQESTFFSRLGIIHGAAPVASLIHFLSARC